MAGHYPITCEQTVFVRSLSASPFVLLSRIQVPEGSSVLKNIINRKNLTQIVPYNTNRPIPTAYFIAESARIPHQNPHAFRTENSVWIPCRKLLYNQTTYIDDEVAIDLTVKGVHCIKESLYDWYGSGLWRMK